MFILAHICIVIGKIHKRFSKTGDLLEGSQEQGGQDRDRSKTSDYKL